MAVLEFIDYENIRKAKETKEKKAEKKETDSK